MTDHQNSSDEQHWSNQDPVLNLYDAQEEALFFGGPVPGADRPYRPSDFGADPLTEALESVSDAVIAHEEEIYRRAIRETDWEETAVLRVVRYRPEPQLARSGRFDTEGEPEYRMESEYEIQRFVDRVPDRGAGLERAAEVTTITRPLLDRLAAEYHDVAALLSEGEYGDILPAVNGGASPTRGIQSGRFQSE